MRAHTHTQKKTASAPSVRADLLEDYEGEQLL